MSYAITVKVNKNEGEHALERALKRLKTRVDAEGTLDELRRRRTFMNKTEIKKWKEKLKAKKAKAAQKR